MTSCLCRWDRNFSILKFLQGWNCKYSASRTARTRKRHISSAECQPMTFMFERCWVLLLMMWLVGLVRLKEMRRMIKCVGTYIQLNVKRIGGPSGEAIKGTPLGNKLWPYGRGLESEEPRHSGGVSIPLIPHKKTRRRSSGVEIFVIGTIVWLEAEWWSWEWKEWSPRHFGALDVGMAAIFELLVTARLYATSDYQLIYCILICSPKLCRAAFWRQGECPIDWHRSWRAFV